MTYTDYTPAERRFYSDVWLALGYRGAYVMLPNMTWAYRLTHWTGFSIWIRQ